MRKNKDNKPLLIIDGYGFIFRAYHVQPPLTSPTGMPVGAIYGFTSMLLKLINDFKPEYAVIVLDHGGKNFRHDIYTDYKSHRPPISDDLIEQLKLVKSASEALNFACISKSGFEADDLIATLADHSTKLKKPALIISSDKDLMQLVNDHVGMYDPTKSKYITNEDILNKFGVEASKIREVQSLMGDKSDNIPGITGFGPKTAAQLINQFGDITKLFSSIDKVGSPRQQELLRKYKNDALISWQLVGLDNNVEIDKDIDNFHWSFPTATNITQFLNKYGFKSLKKRVENILNIEIDNSVASNISESTTQREPNKTKTPTKIIEVNDKEQLKPLMEQVKLTGKLAVDVHSDDSNIKISLFCNDNLYLVPYIQEDSSKKDLFSYANAKLSNTDLNNQLHRIFSDSSIKKITYNLKQLLQICSCELQSFDDLQIMHYILSAGLPQKNINEIVKLYAQNQFDINKSKVIIYFFECYEKLKEELFASNSMHLYEDIDLPICHILHKMEQNGIKIDINYLSKLSAEFTNKINILEEEIFSIAGEEFNISSPKQLGKVLFDNMKIPMVKTTSKTKLYSTNASVLEHLQEQGHEIASLLLKYRHFTKLKNTYTDALPKQVEKQTSKIHTTFLQTATSTGRLSSVNPNIQNIPIRTQEGNNIRAAFIAPVGMKLISADYSQIELRIFSHVANIESLKQAFLKNIDIHSHTASQIFGHDLEKIDADMRRKAKAINFGIIYGISVFGLANQLGITRAEADNYIKKYFDEYPGIQRYMSEIIEFAKENNFVQNNIGRKCFLPTINDKNHALRSFGERAAINAPMQSLAADIVKMAMINLDKEFTKQSMKTKMILQIHDELIFESPDNEVEQASSLIKSIMENAFLLDVSTNVTVNSGKNWREIH